MSLSSIGSKRSSESLVCTASSTLDNELKEKVRGYVFKFFQEQTTKFRKEKVGNLKKYCEVSLQNHPSLEEERLFNCILKLTDREIIEKNSYYRRRENKEKKLKFTISKKKSSTPLTLPFPKILFTEIDSNSLWDDDLEVEMQSIDENIFSRNP